MASPAGPNLTLEDYVIILALLTLNPTADNAPIREKIAAFISARDAWSADARRRNINNPW